MSVGDVLLNVFFGRLPRVIARSLREEPHNWRLDSDDNPYLEETYKLLHRNGTTVWVASGSAGVDVKMPGCAPWGGVTYASVFGLSPGHHLIWLSAKPYLARRRQDRRPRAERFLELREEADA